MQTKFITNIIRSEISVQLLKAIVAAIIVGWIFLIAPSGYGSEEASAWENFDTVYAVVTPLMRNKITLTFLAAATSCMVLEVFKQNPFLKEWLIEFGLD
ncbi:MAG TPA: hypothetical protein DDX13_05335 [Marinobacter adhaerens]|nr:hypothetical protein [Rhodopirellula sp.]HBF93069.1 hypothetical protein [Marinobacter adhaerens]